MERADFPSAPAAPAWSAPLVRSPLAATRIALLGCAYGNLPAFDACLADAAEQGCQRIVFLGDALGFCGHGGEMVERLWRDDLLAVAGNHDREGAAGSRLCGCGFADPIEEAASCTASERQLDGLDEVHASWLAGLPDLRLLETPAGRILACHGSPERINQFLFPETLDRGHAERWLDAAGAEVLACSHSGLPWAVRIGDGRLVVNAGACGRPDHDGDPAVHYLVLDLQPAPRVVVRRVAYDHQAWADQLLTEGVVPALVDQLRTGCWAYGSAALPAGSRPEPVAT